MKNTRKILALCFFIILCEAAGIFGSLITINSIPTWYASIIQPSFTPPNWIFGPVWITLYAMMGFSIFLIWQKGIKEGNGKHAFWFFMAHLAVNAIWTPIFFGLHNLYLALFVIVVLWMMIAYLIKIFLKIDRLAAYLLIPYLFWVSFATALNAAFAFLN